MKVLEIPISSDAPHFVQENEVFGQTLSLEFEWIEIRDFWMLHIFDGHDQPIALGIKFQPEWPLFTEHYAGFSLMLLSHIPGQILQRSTLKDGFTLVAYETV